MRASNVLFYFWGLLANNFFNILVFELLLAVSEGKSWKEALLEILPQRKFKPPGARKNRNQATNKESDSDYEDQNESQEINDEKMEQLEENS